MPMTAHVRVRRVPIRALLILLGLFLSSGAAASASGELREPLARLGPSRQGPAAALLPSGNRNSLDDEAPGTGGSASLPAGGPAIVTRLLWARPLADAPLVRFALLRRATNAAYRARAPPAV